MHAPQGPMRSMHAPRGPMRPMHAPRGPMCSMHAPGVLCTPQAFYARPIRSMHAPQGHMPMLQQRRLEATKAHAASAAPFGCKAAEGQGQKKDILQGCGVFGGLLDSASGALPPHPFETLAQSCGPLRQARALDAHQLTYVSALT